ncbi:MAG: DUF6056 family protein [Bacteroidetes bacterium]|nr:DUF6056 family protein [Bacteroidota bacterium]
MSKSYRLFLSTILTLFAGLLLMLCYFNRLATDDFYFIWDVRNQGIIKGVTSQYMQWCGRFAATFFMDIFYKGFDIQQSYYSLFPFISASLLLAGVYFLLKNIGRKLFLTFSKSQFLLASASFTAMLFFLSFDIGESWFWFCGMSSYLWSIIAFVWGCVFLSNSKYKILSLFGAIFCFIYIGGSSEVYSAIFGLFFTVLLFKNYLKLKDIRIFLSKKRNKKLVFIYTVFAISFLIFLIAPGNYLRDSLFPEHKFFYSFFITAKSFIKFGILYLPFKLVYILTFVSPFLLIGESCKSFPIDNFKIPFRTFFYKISIAFVVILFIFYWMVAYVMVESGPPRVLFLVSFLLSIYCCCIFFFVGYKGILNKKYFEVFKITGLVLGFGMMIFLIFSQYKTASTYAKAYDLRIDYILELNNRIEKDTVIILTPLPPSGMLYSSEITNDTSHFTNKELRLGYKLKYHVISEKKKD